MADPNPFPDDNVQDFADEGFLGSGGPRDSGRRGPEDADLEASLPGYAATPPRGGGGLRPNPLQVLIHWVKTHL